MTREAFTPNAGDSIIVRLKIEGQTQGLSQVTTRIAELKGHIGAIDLVRPLSGGASIRDFSIYTSGSDHGEEIIAALKAVEGIEVIHFSDRTFLMHLGGKIEVTSRQTLKTRDDLYSWCGPGLYCDSPESGRSVQVDDQTQHGCDCDRWYSGSWVGQYRAASRNAGDGR